MNEEEADDEAALTQFKQDLFPIGQNGTSKNLTSTSPPKGLFSIPSLPSDAVSLQSELFQSSSASGFQSLATNVEGNPFPFSNTELSGRSSQPSLFGQTQHSKEANPFGTQFSGYGFGTGRVTASNNMFVSKESENIDAEKRTNLFQKKNPPTPPKGLFSAGLTDQDGPSLAKSTPSSARLFQGAESSASEGSRKRLFGNNSESSPSTQEVSAKKQFGIPEQNLFRSDPRKRFIRKAWVASGQTIRSGSNASDPGKIERKKSTEGHLNIIRRIRLASSSTPQVTTSTIQCTKVPEEHNDRESLRRHFSKFGQITRIRPQVLRNSATIYFSNSEEAALAKEKGKNFYGRAIHIYFYKPRTLSTDKPPNQLEASSSSAPKAVKSAVRRAIAAPESGRTEKSRSLLAKTNAEKLALLDKIDKLLRAQTIKQSDLSKAVMAIGTCPDMCPEKERYLRLEKNLLSLYEMGPNKTMDHRLVVKEYSRSSADQEEALSHELRPSSVLRITMDYLLTRVMNTIDYEKTAEWYDFIWNRTRAIRKEISIQQLNDAIAIEVTEECARFHICCAHELCEMDVSNFDPKINNENLEKTMKTVLDMYVDVHLHNKDFQPPNEAEFQSYFILLNINRSSDVLRAVKNMQPDIRYSEEVRIAVSAFSALHSNNYSRFFTVVDQSSYLQAALLHRYFNQVRQQAIRIMRKAYTSKPQCSIPMGDVIRALHFNDVVELEAFCASHEINVVNNQLILLRAIDYFAENMTSFRSTEICHKMRGSDLGDVIAHGRHPMLEFPPPTSSFDEEGYYIGPHVNLLTSSTTSTKSVTASPKRPAFLPVQSTSELQVAELHEILRQKGISNDTVKFLAKELFLEIIEEMTRMTAEQEYETAQKHVISSLISNTILNQAVESFLRKIVADGILAEKNEIEQKRQEAEEKERKRREEQRRREEEERRRREEEQRRKEKLERFARCTIEVADQIKTEVMTTEMERAAAAEYREALLDHNSSTFTEQVLNNSVASLLREIVSESVKTERKHLLAKLSEKLMVKRKRIRWTKWRHHLEKIRLFRLSCEIFPCTSLSRDIDQQIRALLSDERKKKLLSENAANSKLTMQPFSRLLKAHTQAHDDVIQLCPLIEAVHYDVLPFNKIVFENYKQSQNQNCLFWKVGLAASELQESIWKTWIYHKFGFRTKGTSTIKQTLLHKSSRNDVIVTSSPTCVCCKMLGSGKQISEGACGRHSLVMLVSDTDLANLGEFMMFVDQLLLSMRSIPAIPVLIVFCGCGKNEKLITDILEAYSVITSIQTVELNTDDFVLNCKRLQTGIEWLVSVSSFNPGVKFSPLRDLLEDQLSRCYIAPMYRDLGLRTQQKQSSMDPFVILDAYNSVLHDLCSCLTDVSLLDISWPASELCEWKNKHQVSSIFPSETWNSKLRMIELENIFEKLLLPSLPQLHACDTVDHLAEEMNKYCRQVCPQQPHLALSISRLIQSFVGNNGLDDVADFIRCFPWQRVVDAVASTIFKNILYDKQGDLVVGFYEELLETVMLPQALYDEFHVTEFEDLDQGNQRAQVPLDPTLNSSTYGASVNLKTILDKSRNKENTLVSIKRDWLNDDDVEENSTNEALAFRNEIQDELNTSERFERDLENLIEDGAEILEQYFG